MTPWRMVSQSRRPSLSDRGQASCGSEASTNAKAMQYKMMEVAIIASAEDTVMGWASRVRKRREVRAQEERMSGCRGFDRCRREERWRAEIVVIA